VAWIHGLLVDAGNRRQSDRAEMWVSGFSHGWARMNTDRCGVRRIAAFVAWEHGLGVDAGRRRVSGKGQRRLQWYSELGVVRHSLGYGADGGGACEHAPYVNVLLVGRTGCGGERGGRWEPALHGVW
jgi:hypothetical protein